MSTSVWLVLLGYLAGSIPFGLLVARVTTGVDVRKTGSGNIGATNVLRVAGSRAGAVTLALDALKGWAPVALSQILGAPEIVIAAVGLAAFLGHVYPLFLGFHGGKGVATALGVLLALFAKIALLIVGVWLLVAAVFRYSSLAALVTAVTAPVLIWVLDGRPAYVGLAVIICGFILIRHRENIERLMAGHEGKIGKKLQGADLPQRDRLAL
ncbi:glycerol-3-phosphate acyltransferase [Candidatus Methylomirabilis lanthanidiphila]|uniref:Glycerol-3-phosphate acyltransferase n=1 Tax=Candidatus Methylomirabilis lanthanidiphila TaxID=2211376 RepID=A0A564ZGU0_9BACT|nr:glycerol-3-phosphate 1-O-acyltransferase PlsY [Candidatus Methylomirabilis lanthanidiphila]VUZ83862.1 glycerol-3-phosphate acyltransferase [Candidatus Methylomirabilis lanthanidiphila]